MRGFLTGKALFRASANDVDLTPNPSPKGEGNGDQDVKHGIGGGQPTGGGGI